MVPFVRVTDLRYTRAPIRL